jgi:SAM-dependent methyltransferase
MKPRIPGVPIGGARDRNLSEINPIIFSAREPLLEQLLDEIIVRRGDSPERPTRVLEIGFGEGAGLLEFAWKFRERPVEFHGIDAAVGPKGEITVRSQDDLRDLPSRYEVLREVDVDAIPLPQLAFYAVGAGTPQELALGRGRGIDHPTDSLDLIYSVATLRFVPDKARVIEEVCRVLAPGGTALLDVDDYEWDYTAEATDGTFDFEQFRGRLLLLHGERPVPIPLYLAHRGAAQVTFRFLPVRRMLLKIVKNDARPFTLGVRYDHKHSLSSAEMPRHPNGRLIGGVRSAYQVAPRIIETMVFPWQRG